MEVAIASTGLLCPAGIGSQGVHGGRPGPVPGFRPRAYISNRKTLKLMSRAVKLGVSAIAIALAQASGELERVPPERRAMFVGSNPLGGGLEDLLPALDVSTDAEGALDLRRFAEQGIPRIHPLWLVKGLSNNVLGFASMLHDFQGPNANYCQGPSSGLLALHEAWATLVEGRADLAVAGAADSLVDAQALFPGRPLGEGAAFFVLRPARPGDSFLLRPGKAGPPVRPEESDLGHMGVAGSVVSLARAVLAGRLPVTVSQEGTAVHVFMPANP